MLALERQALYSFTPTWQIMQLIILFEQLFACNEFQTLILFYDNATIGLSDLLLHRLVEQPAHQHDLVTYNIDRYLPAQQKNVHFGGFSQFVDPPLVTAELTPCFARSVTVEVFGNQHSRHVNTFRRHLYRLRPETRWIRIYRGEAPPKHNYYRYVALVELLENDVVRLSTFNFQQQQPLHLFSVSELSMYRQLFFDQRIDMLGLRLFMWGGMDVPNLYRATAFDKWGRKVFGLYGMYAAICSMIGGYFNASMAFTLSDTSRKLMWNRPQPHETPEFKEKYVEYERLRHRVYRTDYVLPGSAVTGEHCSLFDEYMAEGTAMYPHRQENYVVLVPNERQHPPELWKLISASPMLSIWLGSIFDCTLSRYLFQWIERRFAKRFGNSATPWDLDRVLLETCGLAFGMSVAVRSCGRADRMLIVSLSLFAIVSGVFTSGMLLQKFAFGNMKPKIDRLADLVNLANMTLMMPKGLVVNETSWNANHTLIYMSLPVIYGEILSRNTRCTYVLPESVADVLLSEPHMSEDNGNFPVFHKLRERVLSKHMSIYSTEDIIAHPLNILMSRMRYMGLISYFEHQQKLVLQVRETRSTKSPLGPQSTQSSGPPSSSSSITFRELSFIVWLVFVGQVCSVAMFGLELLVARFKAMKSKKIQSTHQRTRTRTQATVAVLPYLN